MFVQQGEGFDSLLLFKQAVADWAIADKFQTRTFKSDK
jgi:hypothetical protein